MADDRAMRTCQKTACRWPAAASLSYRYDTRQVWLLDLSEDPDPSLYDLCPHHADSLVVMRGWEQVDHRTEIDPVVEPAGRDLLPGSGHPPIGLAGYGGNRYSELVEDLPRLAAQVAADEEASEPEGQAPQSPAAPANGGEDATAEAAERAADAAPVEGPAGATGAAATVGRPAPIPSRDLAPLPAPEPTPAPGEEPPEVELPGQLAIPVPEDEPELGEAVVVSISARRRQPADR
jgi:hypothetical protein